jgi:hypothetical protein
MTPGEAGWRKKGFYSVLDAQGSQAALMARMLELGHKTPLTPNAKLPEEIVLGLNRNNMCPMPHEFDAYAGAHPKEGMPLAVTGLTDQNTRPCSAGWRPVRRWKTPIQPSAAEAQQIAEWEELLNRPGSTEALVGRWLYEHLFLAHIYFKGGEQGHFFQWVRSRTPSGQPVDLIATRRPNDRPAPTSTTGCPGAGRDRAQDPHHLPAERAKLKRVKQLFYSGDWQADALPGYGPRHRANPFETFEAIPAVARQFMLDNAEYFVRTFIRGPVCRGQIATDVIRDNFWALFQEPATTSTSPMRATAARPRRCWPCRARSTTWAVC